MNLAIAIAFVALQTDTSDYEPGEIRPLQEAGTMGELVLWDGKTEKREPRDLDVGLDKAKEMYYFRNGEWKSVNE